MESFTLLVNQQFWAGYQYYKTIIKHLLTLTSIRWVFIMCRDEAEDHTMYWDLRVQISLTVITMQIDSS